MTDSNKKPASATPGKPAGRTTPATPARAAKGAAARPSKATGAKASKSGKAAKPGKPAPKPKRNATPDAAPPPRREPTAVPLAPAKRALGWTHTARFLTTASQLHHLPANNGQVPLVAAPEDIDADAPDAFDPIDPALLDEHGEPLDTAGKAIAESQLPAARMLPEIAFVGRSNAGKSTAINTLAQQKRLAFASKTPGRTQHINLFVLGPKDEPDALFADLPGYGYAAVARGAKLRWQRVMADYLSDRASLSGVVLMVDSRLGLTDLDKQLLEFVSDRVTAGEVSLLVLLTKSDKLNRKEGAAILAQVEKDLAVLATDDSDIAITLFSALNKQGLDDVAELLYEWAHREPRELSAEDDAGHADDADDAEDGVIDDEDTGEA